jgi:Rrf2 family protein
MMSANSQSTIALHILARIRFEKDRNDAYLSSDVIARSVNTNPVFIRRILTALNKAGLVLVRRGSVNSGWKLAKNAEDITLLDVYDAVSGGPLLELHHSEPNDNCPVGRGIKPALRQYYDRAEQMFRNELAAATLESVYQGIMDEAEKR